MKTHSEFSLKTEADIHFVKETFEKLLSQQLELTRVSAPLFVSSTSGLQDNLNGTERPVSFPAKTISAQSFQIVHSLAKWKRLALARYGVEKGQGIVTDMRALRPDEPDLSSGIHSIYVDQWDWECVMDEEERTLGFLKSTVQKIYRAIIKTERAVCERTGTESFLPETISFVHTEELEERWPEVTPKERENLICKELGAVFLIGIGGGLAQGEAHDGRAPDYDDWTTHTSERTRGLNGDILVWYPVLERAFEISSMGIRVDALSLLRQLKIRGCEDRIELPWHKLLIEGKLPQTVGGGIGQSRLAMLMLRKSHIGQVQAAAWPDQVISSCQEKGIALL